jgi:membrane protein
MRIKPVRIVKEMALVFIRQHVSRSAAALSYYLTISIFPFLICLSAILGSLHVYESEVFVLLEDIMPSQTFSTITDFLRYVSSNRSELMLVIGLTAMLTSSSAAFRSFIGIMGEIQGEMRFTGLWRGVFSFIISISFLVAVYVSGLVLLSGGWLMQILELYFGLGKILTVWTWIRFLILFLLLFFVIYGMYIISAPKETKRTHRLPGALVASVVLVAASILYSRMISASLKYTLLYGSLASFIILMICLYTCAIILIMGNVFNISLQKNKAPGLKNI